MIDELLTEHARHGYLPGHVTEAMGARLQVSERAVMARFTVATRRLAIVRPIRFSRTALDRIASCVDFLSAYQALGGAATLAPYAVFERALWLVPGRTLAALRERERGRRIAFERRTTGCTACATANAGPASIAA